MKKLPLEIYPPLARKAVIFLRSAIVLQEVQNREIGSWETSYYLLSHSLELSIKALVHKSTGNYPEKIHDKELLSQKYREICSFTDTDMETIRELKLLNNGPGGLRYDNLPLTEFKPHMFNNGVKIVEKLLEKFE